MLVHHSQFLFHILLFRERIDCELLYKYDFEELFTDRELDCTVLSAKFESLQMYSYVLSMSLVQDKLWT